MLEPSAGASAGNEQPLSISRSPVRGVRPVLLSRWDHPTDTFDHRFTRPEIVQKLAAWAGVSPEEWSADVARRKTYLDKMKDDGVRGIGATRSKIASYES
jgi:hypothetical protein